eukprot:855018_1
MLLMYCMFELQLCTSANCMFQCDLEQGMQFQYTGIRTRFSSHSVHNQIIDTTYFKLKPQTSLTPTSNAIITQTNSSEQALDQHFTMSDHDQDEDTITNKKHGLSDEDYQFVQKQQQHAIIGSWTVSKEASPDTMNNQGNDHSLAILHVGNDRHLVMCRPPINSATTLDIVHAHLDNGETMKVRGDTIAFIPPQLIGANALNQSNHNKTTIPMNAAATNAAIDGLTANASDGLRNIQNINNQDANQNAASVQAFLQNAASVQDHHEQRDAQSDPDIKDLLLEMKQTLADQKTALADQKAEINALKAQIRDTSAVPLPQPNPTVAPTTMIMQEMRSDH